MKKTISILGSTGSIGLSTLNIIDKKKSEFKIVLLAANNNFNLICKQIKKYKPKYYISKNKSVYTKVNKQFKNKNIIILNTLNNLNFKKKLDLSVAAIPGIAGLEPTISLIKFISLGVINNLDMRYPKYIHLPFGTGIYFNCLNEGATQIKLFCHTE